MADVSVQTTTLSSSASARAGRTLVFTTDLIGYCFYGDIGVPNGTFAYGKTNDGGATWTTGTGAHNSSSTVIIAFDVWFDQWTPGDTGTKIHVWYFDATDDIVWYRNLDTASGTLSPARTLAARAAFVGASAVAGRGAFVSGCKTRSGYLYCAYDLDAGAERGFHRSTDGGTTWSANLSTTFVEATLDTCKLYPASGTGDDNDCWALYYDASALALTLKLWDSSAAAQVESATIGVAHTDGATDLTGQFGYDASVRHSDGHLIVAALSGRDVAASTHQVFDITDTSTITTKTAIAASTDDHYYPQVTINQSTNDLYVAYNGKRDGSDVLDTTSKVYYTKSTDGGTTWSAGDTAYMEGAAGAVQQVWTPLSGLRFYAVWRVGTTLVGNKVNSVSLPAGPADQAVTGTTLTSTAALNAGTVAPSAVTLTGATLGSGASVNAGTVSTAGAAQAVTGTTLTTGAAVTAGTVAPGAVTTTGATIGSGAQTFSGSVTPGAVTLTGATLTSSVVVRTGTVTTLTAVSGATLGSTATLTAGSVTTTTAVTGATLGSSLVLRAGTVTTTTSVTGTTRASTLALFPGAVSLTTAGAIDGAVILNSAALFPGLVTPGAVLVTGATRGTSAQVFPGSLAAAAVAVVTDEPFAWLM